MGAAPWRCTAGRRWSSPAGVKPCAPRRGAGGGAARHSGDRRRERFAGGGIGEGKGERLDLWIDWVGALVMWNLWWCVVFAGMALFFHGHLALRAFDRRSIGRVDADYRCPGA